ncbi:UDP-N-acetylmuramoyl-tripeptide--D-alanyl-D-alanine ligase [candidate division KSB1 bacterium]|nr:MAG: UDP-N-acetylmuramoyl-tripeptide--D-alanyl-D-alanine ligase [candidate division KSB1 bacterium]
MVEARGVQRVNLPTIGWFCQAVRGKISDLKPDTPLGPISIDTRTIRERDTFCALTADRDGHDFVPEAFKRGAKAAIVESEWMNSEIAKPFRNQLIGVDDTLTALRIAAQAWRNTLTMPIIAITGTNGKTSTKDLTLRLLSLRYKVAGTQGNLNNEIGLPLTILSIGSDCGAAVVELGASHIGDIQNLCEICQPTHGLVTSIGKAHLQGFGNLAAVAQAKGELYGFLSEQSTAFVPTDDELVRKQAKRNPKKVGYGFQLPPADWDGEYHRGVNLNFDALGRAHFTFDGEELEVGIPGRPAALAALAAVTIAVSMGIAKGDCVKTLVEWKGVPGRGWVEQIGGVVLLDDCYNANPGSMRAALETLSLLSGEKKLAILGDMNELGSFAEAEHRTLGRELGLFGVQRGIFLGSFARIAAQEARQGGVEAFAFETYEELDKRLQNLAADFSAILVKGSRGMRMERVVDKLKQVLA